jgi:mRNA interferase MazF
VNLGDIHWVVLPAAAGHVQQGRRPGIIWQDHGRFPGLPTTLVLPLTSRLATLRFGGTHLIQPSIRNGLSVASVAMVFQLAAVDVRDVDTRIGELEDPDRLALIDLTKQLIGLP